MHACLSGLIFQMKTKRLKWWCILLLRVDYLVHISVACSIKCWGPKLRFCCCRNFLVISVQCKLAAANMGSERFQVQLHWFVSISDNELHNGVLACGLSDVVRMLAGLIHGSHCFLCLFIQVVLCHVQGRN